jgi:hypothetical protein
MISHSEWMSDHRMLGQKIDGLEHQIKSLHRTLEAAATYLRNDVYTTRARLALEIIEEAIKEKYID